jgi:tRNA nucleotidyltransferase (CCA-adding enzyme)
MELSSEPPSLQRARREIVPPALLEALDGTPAYLVGGAVRDMLIGIQVDDLDVAVEGEIEPILDRLGAEAESHERFGTASVEVAGHQVDLARTRRERYPHPGALPEIAPAPIRTDLARRDFTINAMAVPLSGDVELIDPYEGLTDLGDRVLRVTHPESFTDDPTRALRAARYAARIGMSLDPETARWLRAADLSTVSDDRVEADLRRLCEEPEAEVAFRLLDEWGLLEIGAERLALMPEVSSLCDLDPWAGLVDRAGALLDAATCPPARLARSASLAEIDPTGPASARFEAAAGLDDSLLLLARAQGADWLDEHVGRWREVRLSIDGKDLMAAGVEEGPAVGIGLQAALAARIDGRVAAEPGAELEIALAAIRASGRI